MYLKVRRHQRFKVNRIETDSHLTYAVLLCRCYKIQGERDTGEYAGEYTDDAVIRIGDPALIAEACAEGTKEGKRNIPDDRER